MNLIGWTIEHHIKDVNALGGSLTLEEKRKIEVKSVPSPFSKGGFKSDKLFKDRFSVLTAT
jgi:hypothetical protein